MKKILFLTLLFTSLSFSQWTRGTGAQANEVYLFRGTDSLVIGNYIWNGARLDSTHMNIFTAYKNQDNTFTGINTLGGLTKFGSHSYGFSATIQLWDEHSLSYKNIGHDLITGKLNFNSDTISLATWQGTKIDTAYLSSSIAVKADSAIVAPGLGINVSYALHTVTPNADTRKIPFKNAIGIWDASQYHTARDYFSSFNVDTIRGRTQAVFINDTLKLLNDRFVYFGGVKSLFTNSSNTQFGYSAGGLTSGGTANALFGSYAGYHITSAHDNVLIGANAGYMLDTSNTNVFIGKSAGYYTINAENTMVGHNSGFNNVDGHGNVFIGKYSGYGDSTGYANVEIGKESGMNNKQGISNIYLGYRSGYWRTDSNKLWIGNSNTAMPILFGDISNGRLSINDTTNTSYNLYVNGTQYTSDSSNFGGNIIVNAGNTATITLDGTVGTERVGTQSIWTQGGGLYSSSRGNIRFGIDNDGNSTAASFDIYSNGLGSAGTGGNLLFSANENTGATIRLKGTTNTAVVMQIERSASTTPVIKFDSTGLGTLVNLTTTGLSTFGTNGGTTTIPSGGIAKVYVSGLTTSGKVAISVNKGSFVTLAVADTIPSWNIPSTDTLYIRYKYNEVVSYAIMKK
jgi:hypothetical protein